MRSSSMLLVLGSLLWGCDFSRCDPPDLGVLSGAPERLSEAGLFSDLARETLAEGVRPYRPAFELWSDGAVKRRWIYLPPDTEIDTLDADDWVFPIGTRLYKEFVRDGVRVETRLLERVGPAETDWRAVAYVWTEAGDEAYARPDGAVDALGTEHDVPAADRCMGCHGGRASRVLGFSALQLAHDDDDPDSWTLARLIGEGRLSSDIDSVIAVPGTATERAALGYLHANCGHCHNEARPHFMSNRCFDPDNDVYLALTLRDLGDVTDTATYRSAVGTVVRPGAPEESRLLQLVTHRGGGLQMPPLATERIDPDGSAVLRAWIESL